MVHKFITKGTIEEKIDTIIEEKQKLSKDLLASGGEQWITEYNNEELMKIFALNLESYADYINRIARGKSYVRSNMVLDLKITKGKVTAKVQGSRSKPYDVEILIDALSSDKWKHITALCNNSIA